MIRISALPLLALALLLPACTSHLQQKEDFLREAGFRTVTPTTPAQLARVKALPQGHITQVTRKGQTLFMLADEHRNLLLVGGNPQLERYQAILYKKKVNPAIINDAYDKAFMMDGDAFGPWGGMYGPWGGGMGFY